MYGAGVAGEAHVLEVAGREVRITSPDKVFFAERGETKLDLVRYYRRSSEPLMRAMGGRPVLMQRFPQGAGGPSFFQKRVPEERAGLAADDDGRRPQRHDVERAGRRRPRPPRVGREPRLPRLPRVAVPADDPDHADELRIDLDPQPGTGFAEVRAAAHELEGAARRARHRRLPEDDRQPRPPRLRAAPAALGLLRRCAPPRSPSPASSSAAGPTSLTAAWWKEERGERIFVDYNQNAPHKTVFGAWSVRARMGAQVSTPLRWDELDDVDPDELTIADRPAAGSPRDGDPWAAIDDDAAVARAAARDARARPARTACMDAPWPPVYPKQPDEPPRVAPSRARTQTES